MDRRELERGIVGAIIGRPEKLAAMRNAVVPEHFRYVRHLVEAILTTFDQGFSVDVTTIAVAGKLPSENVAQLYGIEPLFSAQLPVLLCVLAEEAIRDEVMDWRAHIRTDGNAFKLLRDVEALQRKIESIIGVSTRPGKAQILKKYTEHCRRDQDTERIPTPLSDLNMMLYGGWAAGAYALIGGTPGSGKTSFMLSLALHAARAGAHVAFIEGEMTAEEILERLNGISTGEEIAALRRAEHHERLVAPFVAQFSDLPFELIPLYERTLERLISEVAAQIHLGAKLIFVDYLQVFTPKRADKYDEFMEIRETSQRLRLLALQHGVCLVVASSLNRSETRSDKLSLNSFYGSSGLGHDCSIGLILAGERSDTQELLNPVRNVTLHVVKNRNGVCGEIALKFHLRSQRFEELAAIE